MTLHVLQKIERDDVPVDFFRRIIGKYRQDEGLWCRFFNFFFGGGCLLYGVIKDGLHGV